MTSLKTTLKSLLTCAFLLAGTLAWSQDPGKKISIDLDGVSLSQVIQEVQQASGFTFFYDPGQIDLNSKVTLRAENLPLQSVLERLSGASGLDFRISGNQILIYSPQKAKSAKIQADGTVMDNDGEPLPGVYVLQVGSSNGTLTDSRGHFSINVPQDAQLSFTFLGFGDETRDASTRMKVVMNPDRLTLEESVVVGFGVQKRQNLTGAVATISSEELAKRPVTSSAAAIQGLDPSVHIDLGTGSPESSYKIDIRGAASINSSSPLILVDGMEMDLRAVNPNDIESISVLKDASASSIYGAKASAGVVLVTTRSGEASERAKVSYSYRYGLAENTSSTDYITTGYDHVVLCNRFYNSYQGQDLYTYPEATGELQKLLDRRNDKTENPQRPWVEVGADGRYRYYGNFDWYGYLYNRTRGQHEHNVSISGGNDKINYYVSGRFLDQEGIFRIYGDTYRNASFRGKMSARLFPKLKYTLGTSFDRSEMRYPGRANYEQTIFQLYIQNSPAFLPKNPDGTIVGYPNQLSTGSPTGQGVTGAIVTNNAWNSKVTQNMVISNRFDWELVKGLTATASYSFKLRTPINRYRNNTYDYSREIDKIATYSAGSCENAYEENRYSETTENWDAYATYKNNFGANHHFTAVAGMQYQNYRYTNMRAKQYGLSNEKLASFSIADGEITLKQDINTLRTLGFFARVNYDYAGKYLVELSARGDGSSRFAPGHRWGFFPSASIGWRVSDEPFFKPLKGAWDNFKLRLSAGSLGNQQVSGYYTYLDVIDKDMMNFTFDGNSFATTGKISSPTSRDLSWETVTTYNLGLDMSFLRSRLSLNTDFYIRDTKNMLTTSLTLPDVFGAATPKANCANLRTKGYEIYLRWNDRVKAGGSELGYGITATFGDYISKITKFNNPEKLLSDYYEGMTLGEIWGYHVEGLFASDEEAAEYHSRIDDSAVNSRVYVSKGKGESTLRAGDVRFADLDGNRVISTGAGTVNDPGDRMIIGNSKPRYNYSFRFDFDYKNIDLSVFFQGVGKRDWYPTTGNNAVNFWGPYSFPGITFIDKRFESLCWSEENPDAYFPRQRGYATYGDGTGGAGGGALASFNDRYIQNVGYLRLKNLSLGYTFHFPKVKWIRSIRLGLSGENLWYWSALKKYCRTMDPEIAITSNSYETNSGVGYAYSRIYSFHLDVNF